MPLFLAWVLSCLILSASFQHSQISDNESVTKQSPLAQFNHSGSNYSLRFNGIKLNAKDNVLEDNDSPLGLLSSLIPKIIVVTSNALPAWLHQVSGLEPRYRLRPRAPPISLK